MTANGLLHLPQHGVLHDVDEASILAAIDELVKERKLVRRGRNTRRWRCRARQRPARRASSGAAAEAMAAAAGR